MYLNDKRLWKAIGWQALNILLAVICAPLMIGGISYRAATWGDIREKQGLPVREWVVCNNCRFEFKAERHVWTSCPRCRVNGVVRDIESFPAREWKLTR